MKRRSRNEVEHEFLKIDSTLGLIQEVCNSESKGDRSPANATMQVRLIAEGRTDLKEMNEVSNQLASEVSKKQEKTEVDWEFLKAHKALSTIGEICLSENNHDILAEDAIQEIRLALNDYRS